jgi:hypothetical protein
VVGIGGFLLVQLTGLLGRTGRLLAWVGAGKLATAGQLEAALRGFYGREWRSFAVATGFHFVGWLIGALEGLLVLRTLGVSASLSTATVIEALGSGVRFATFFVPASLGTLEGANAAAFTAFGWAAAAGLAFSRSGARRSCGSGSAQTLVAMDTRSSRVGAKRARPASLAPGRRSQRSRRAGEKTRMSPRS